MIYTFSSTKMWTIHKFTKNHCSTYAWWVIAFDLCVFFNLKTHSRKNTFPTLYQKANQNFCFGTMLVKMETLNPQCCTRQALNLESLNQFNMLDELRQMAQGSGSGACIQTEAKMIEALEMESTLKSPTSIPVRKGANFFQERLAPLPSVMRGDETNPGLPIRSVMSQDVRKRKTVNNTGGKMFRVLGTASGCQGNTQWNSRGTTSSSDTVCFASSQIDAYSLCLNGCWFFGSSKHFAINRAARNKNSLTHFD